MMTLGFLTLQCPDRPLEELFPKLASWGYEAVEIFAGGVCEPSKITGRRGERIEKLLEENSLQLSAIAGHTEYWVGKEKAAISRIKRCIDIAKHLGTDIVATSAGIYPKGMDKHEAWNRLVKALRKAVDYAAINQVRIALEPHFGCMIFAWESALRILREINSPYLKINCDASHWYAMGFDDTVAVEKLKDYIIHVHLKGLSFIKPPLSDMVDGVVHKEYFKGNALGDCEYNTERHIAQLKSIGYSGSLSVEMAFLDDLDKAAERSAVYMKKLLRKFQ